MGGSADYYSRENSESGIYFRVVIVDILLLSVRYLVMTKTLGECHTCTSRILTRLTLFSNDFIADSSPWTYPKSLLRVKIADHGHRRMHPHSVHLVVRPLCDRFMSGRPSEFPSICNPN